MIATKLAEFFNTMQIVLKLTPKEIRAHFVLYIQFVGFAQEHKFRQFGRRFSTQRISRAQGDIHSPRLDPLDILAWNWPKNEFTVVDQALNNKMELWHD